MFLGDDDLDDEDAYGPPVKPVAVRGGEPAAAGRCRLCFGTCACLLGKLWHSGAAPKGRL